MDKIYESYKLQASPKICLKDYFEEYSKLLESSIRNETDISTEEKICRLMDVELSESRLFLIRHYCSIDNLKSSVENVNDEKNKEVINDKISEKISDKIQLETIKALKIYNTALLKKQKYENGIQITYEKSQSDSITFNLTPAQDFLLYVRVYEPFKYNQPRHHKKQTMQLRLRNVISILGYQTLCQLRDKIMCLADLSISKETSENPDSEIRKMAKDVYKSGFFYIEDTFYNDTREPTNIDYSSIILKWAESRNIGPFKVASMENTHINSLCVRFGFPWVYQHQGSCEHLIVLTDARLINESDDLAASVYPRIERIKSVPGKTCIMCGVFHACWIVTEHDRIPHDTTYFCDKCFRSFNYINGKKIGNFKAYRYPCIPDLLFKKCNNNT